MTLTTTAPWHKASFDTFLNELLPQLLVERVPLINYVVTTTGTYTCGITLTLASPAGDIPIEYANVPQPDGEGIFQMKEDRLAVVPYATYDNLEQARIVCVGEQMEAHLRKRLGRVPEDLVWDSALIRAWLPLDLWIHEFFERSPEKAWPSPDKSWATFVQPLDETNWLARHSHLRRLAILDRQHLFLPGHFGRACPFETPEGPNIGRIVQIALGAEIRSDKLVVVDEQPEATLGLEAAMIPLLEQNTPQRLLMGTNMLRQWLLPPSPEPALIQSGNEPDAPDFWCGRNLLTAFLSWGEDTYENGIVISESCARRLTYDHAVEPGDKLSNRHGTKGVVSRILPDAEMPRLADGTPIELIFNVVSYASFGQIREAVLSRIARAEGRPLILPPFHTPTEQEIRARLAQAGLLEDGMEKLVDGGSGKPLAQPSTVGWVYWGKLVHEARRKLQTVPGRGQRLNEYSYYALREAGAYETLREMFNTGSLDHTESSTLAERLVRGEIEQSSTPSPQLSALLRRLGAVGIRGELREDGLAFLLAEPEGVVLDLAAPMAHPWLRDHVLTRIEVSGGSRHVSQALVEANVRLRRILSSNAPASLTQQAQGQLGLRLREYCATLQPAVLFETRVHFSGRAVVAPGAHLRLDQVGIAEELAWSLFRPLVERELPVERVQARDEEATRVLDEVMARSWVIVHRPPALTPQTFLAFHPVRNANRVIRLHPLVCRFLQADFDGDQVAIFLPLTRQAQQEAGERLSVAGHLARTPDLLRDLLPNNEALWGLARLSLSDAGREELVNILGKDIVPAGEILTRAILAEACEHMLQQESRTRILELLERLTQAGFANARASGASISSFVGSHFPLPPAPAEDENSEWCRYQQEVSEWLAASTDYAHLDLGPQLLAVKSGAWGEIEQLTALLCTQGEVSGIQGNKVPIRHGYRDGLQPAELYALAIGARESFAHIQNEWMELSQEIRKRERGQSFHVLARAMRAEQPELVFAHAASIREIDPLTDVDSRLFAGLPARL